jgi:lipopolysaccharide exporter
LERRLSVFSKFARPAGFVRNVTTMLAGNATAQAIAFLAAPVITRLYVPDDFGEMTYVSSLIAIFSVFACMRYESAIVLPKEEGKAFNIFILCVLSVVIISMLLFLIVAFWGENLAYILNKSWLRPWLWFVPAGVLIQGLFNCLTYMYTRGKHFTSLSVARVSTSVVAIMTKILAGLLLGSTAFWLIGGNIGGLLAAVMVLGWIFWAKNHFALESHVTGIEIINVAREYSKFPKYAMPTGLLNSLSQNLPVLLFAHYFSQDIVGYFGLASAVLRQPISLMGESFGKVYLQKAAELQSQDRNLRDSMIKTTLGLIGVGIVPFGLLTIGGRWIFSFVFGEDWATAGLYAQMIAPWLFLGLINPPATQVIIVRQALRFNLLYNIVTMLMRIGSIVLGYYLLPQPWAVIGAFSACSVLVNLFYISYAFSLTKE